MARLAATMVNLWTTSDAPPAQLADFLFDFDPAAEIDIETTEDEDDAAIEQLQLMFMTATKSMGGEIVENGD